MIIASGDKVFNDVDVQEAARTASDYINEEDGSINISKKGASGFGLSGREGVAESEVNGSAYESTGGSAYAELIIRANTYREGPVDLLPDPYRGGLVLESTLPDGETGYGRTNLNILTDSIHMSKPLLKVQSTNSPSRSWAAKGTALSQYNYKPAAIAGYKPLGLIGACSNNSNVQVNAYYDGSVIHGYVYNHNSSATSTSLVFRFLYAQEGIFE